VASNDTSQRRTEHLLLKLSVKLKLSVMTLTPQQP